MRPLIFVRFTSLSGMYVSGAAAEPQPLQEAVCAPARAGVGRNEQRGAGQLHLDASRSAGAAEHVQRGAHRKLRRPGQDPQDGEPSGLSPNVQSPAASCPAERTGAAEAAHKAVWVRNCGSVSGGRNGGLWENEKELRLMTS